MGLVINKTKGWSFIHIPKTGGTSISNILLKEENSDFKTGHDSVRILEDFKYKYIFTFVRNPFTRIQSAYYHGLRKEEHNYSFEDFLKKSNVNDLWLLPQVFYTKTDKDSLNKISYIGKYENFKNEVNHIFETIGIKSTYIPHLNRNPIYDKHPNLNQHQYYKNLYTEEWMKDLVRERYKDDFKQFNYELEI